MFAPAACHPGGLPCHPTGVLHHSLKGAALTPVLAYCRWSLACACSKAHYHCRHVYQSLLTAMCADAPAQGAEKLLKPPAEPARLPFSAELTWQRALRTCLMQSATLLSDFLGYPWQQPRVPPNQHYIVCFPSHAMGSARTALFQEVMEASTGVPCTWQGLFTQHHSCLSSHSPWSPFAVWAVTLCSSLE